MIYRAVTLLAVLMSSAFASAAGNVSDGPVPEFCEAEGKEEVSKELKVAILQVKNFNSATVGDGAASIQINVYRVASETKDSLVKVELDAEDCTFRNIEVIY